MTTHQHNPDIIHTLLAANPPLEWIRANEAKDLIWVCTPLSVHDLSALLDQPRWRIRPVNGGPASSCIISEREAPLPEHDLARQHLEVLADRFRPVGHTSLTRKLWQQVFPVGEFPNLDALDDFAHRGQRLIDRTVEAVFFLGNGRVLAAIDRLVEVEAIDEHDDRVNGYFTCETLHDCDLYDHIGYLGLSEERESAVCDGSEPLTAEEVAYIRQNHKDSQCDTPLLAIYGLTHSDGRVVYTSRIEYLGFGNSGYVEWTGECYLRFDQILLNTNEDWITPLQPQEQRGDA